MPRYLAFGLGLDVDGVLPRLGGAPPAGHSDVLVRLRGRPAWRDRVGSVARHYASAHCDEHGAPLLCVDALANGWWKLAYADGALFLIDPAGREIFADWPDGMSVDDMSSYFLGPVMGFLLRLHGVVSLHASAVAADGRAFALMGDPGAGKSTTAAAFAALGCAMLADDVTPLRASRSGFDAVPGYPRLRLWPSAVSPLRGISSDIPALPADWRGQRYHLDATAHGLVFQTTPLPLVAVYVLDDRIERASPLIEPVSGRDALAVLVKNSFASRLLTRDMRAHDLDVLSRLAAAVPIRRVQPSADVTRLPLLCDAILADVKGVSAVARNFATPEHDRISPRRQPTVAV